MMRIIFLSCNLKWPLLCYCNVIAPGRGFWSWFGGVCSLTYCNGNFRVMYHCIEFCHDLSLGLGVWNTIHLGSWNVTWYGFMECDMVWYIHVKWLTLWSWWWIIGIWCAVLVFVVTLSGPDNHRVHCSDWLGRVTLVLVHDVFASMT